MPQGLIVSAHGRHFLMEVGPEQRILAHPRGKRTECVVGDRVQWEPTHTSANAQEAVIEAVLPRRNLFYRQDMWRTKSFAANLDQILMMVAGQPLFSESQLSRALIAAHQADIPVIIAHNKIDLPSADTARERLAPYCAMGAELLEMSVKADPEATLRQLGPLLKGKTTLLLGASGTGKSSLVNLLVPQAQTRVGELSQALQAGKHTTTHTTWYWLNEDESTALIDSPGFQEFGLRQVEAASLASLMPDLSTHLGGCRFNNCLHLQEPDCAIRAALEQGSVSPNRYRIYCEILSELQQKRW